MKTLMTYGDEVASTWENICERFPNIESDTAIQLTKLAVLLYATKDEDIDTKTLLNFFDVTEDDLHG